MSSADSIEVSADTVEQAVKDALEQLGAQQDDATIEVLETPRPGVLGVGARQARVRVTRRTPAGVTAAAQSPPPVPAAGESPKPPHPGGGDAPSMGAAATPEEQGREAASILARILELMGEKAQVLQLGADAESVELEIKGDGSGILIGRHGQTLDALEYLVTRILARRIRDAASVSLETESYRARRQQQLHRMALQMGERAKREHAPITLEPMPPRDRRIIHLALKDDPMLTTRSAGEGVIRSVEIVPTGGGNRPPRGEVKRQNQPQRQERPPERQRPAEAIGEQGGFKHGQKRIV